MMTQSRDCSLANFQVLTDRAVFGDVRLGFVAHAFIDRALSRNRGLARGFGPAPSFFQISPVRALELAHLGGQFAFAELVSGALLKFCDVCRLFFGEPSLLRAPLTFRQMYAPTAPAPRYFTARCPAASAR